MLRCSSNCNVQNNSKFVIGLLESIFSDVILEKLFEDFNVKNAAISSSFSQFSKKRNLLLVGKGSKFEGTFTKKFLTRVSRDDRCDDTSRTASSNNFGHAVCFNQGLNNSDVIHTHDSSSTKHQGCSSNGMPNLAKELEFLALRNIRSHYSFHSPG